jgi:predicted kinase
VAEALADEQLKLGNSVIVDAVNAEEEDKAIWRRLASKHQLALTILLVIVSDRALHKQRIESRYIAVHQTPGVDIPLLTTSNTYLLLVYGP